MIDNTDSRETMQLEFDGRELALKEANRTIEDLDVLIDIFIDAILKEEPHVGND